MDFKETTLVINLTIYFDDFFINNKIVYKFFVFNIDYDIEDKFAFILLN